MSRWDEEDKKSKGSTSFLFTRNRVLLLVGSWGGIGFLLGFIIFSP